MMRVTRKHVQEWLAPVRDALLQMRSGEVDAIRGYAVIKMRNDDEFVRTDYCIRGFRGLIERVLPDVDTSPLSRIERHLANGVPMMVSDIDTAMVFLKSLVKPIMRLSIEFVTSAVNTEMIAIEIDALSENTN